jgi:hypothetical protein
MGQKKLCDLAKKGSQIDDLDSYIKIVRKGKYLCTKCGRVSRSKNNICKSLKMEKKNK